MVLLFKSRGHLCLAAAIDDVDLFRAHTLCAARRVHRNVAAADDCCRLGVQNRGIVFFLVRLHEVDTGEVFVCRADALEGFSRNVHEHRKTRAGADEDGLEAELFKQLIDRQDLADDHVGHDRNALRLELFDLVGNNRLRQTELGDTVDQHAACGVERFKDRDLVALLCKLGRARQTRRTGADHGDLDAVGLRLLRHGVDILAIPVGDEALESADGNRLALYSAHALGLALRLLRTDTTRQRGQRVRGGNDFISRGEIALGNLCDKFRNPDVDRAAFDALRLLALHAALCLVDRHLGSVAQGDFLEVLVADVGVLLRHRSLGHLHISHGSSPPLT